MSKKVRLNLATKKTCTGCMACAESCSRGALSMQIADDGHFYPNWNSSLCIDCGLCEKICPVVNGMNYGQISFYSKPYASWTSDEDLIMNSSSGGVFAAIASYVLQKGWYVVGAISVGCEVRHIITNRLEDLSLLQGSKYLQSNLSGIYHQVKHLLNANESVLFSGTGCQVAALLAFLGKRYDNLLTVDLVCAGVPSRLALQKFCEEEDIKPTRISWRNKANGWTHGLQLTIFTNTLTYKFQTKKCFFGVAFLGGMTNRYSCYKCKFCGTDRKSDLTIADYWGVKDFPEQIYKGISLLIIHSKKGAFIVDCSNLKLHLSRWNDCVQHNPRLVYGKKPLRWLMLERVMFSHAIKHWSYRNLKRVYGGDINSSDYLWLPYKAFRYVRWKMVTWITRRKVNQLLKRI